MRISINEKGSEAFYREVVNAAVQYRALMKQPDRKLKDYFKGLKVYGAICGVLFVLCALMGIFWGFDALIIAALVISFLALFASVRYYMSMKKMLDAYLADERTSVLVLDEAGIELDKEDGQVLRMAWGNVAFVRTFEESVCFISDQPIGFMISCLRKYQPEIYAYLKENQIELKII